jgi:hypothetical protein
MGDFSSTDDRASESGFAEEYTYTDSAEDDDIAIVPAAPTNTVTPVLRGYKSLPLSELLSMATLVAAYVSQELGGVAVSCAAALALALKDPQSVLDGSVLQVVADLNSHRLSSAVAEVDGSFAIRPAWRCPFCYDPFVQLLQLPCGHSACGRCWSRYLDGTDDFPQPPTCHVAACRQLCGLRLCQRVGCARYSEVAFERYMLEQANPSAALACRTPSCTYVWVGMLNGRADALECAGCQRTYCAQCHRPNHLPASCADVERADGDRDACIAAEHERNRLAEERQRERQRDESERARIETANAQIQREHQQTLLRRANAARAAAVPEEGVKACPGCRTAIAKIGGCSHIKCTSCRHEFCWNCGGAWTVRHACSAQPAYPHVDPASLGGFNTTAPPRTEHWEPLPWVPQPTLLPMPTLADDAEEVAAPHVDDELVCALRMSLHGLKRELEDDLLQQADLLQRRVTEASVEAVHLASCVYAAHYRDALAVDPLVQCNVDVLLDAVRRFRTEPPAGPGRVEDALASMHTTMGYIRYLTNAA